MPLRCEIAATACISSAWVAFCALRIWQGNAVPDESNSVKGTLNGTRSGDPRTGADFYPFPTPAQEVSQMRGSSAPS